MLYFYFHSKMLRINKIASFFLFLAALIQPVGAGEKRLVFQGHTPNLLVDRNGNFLMIHQNPSQGLSLAVASAGIQKGDIKAIIDGPSLSSPVVKQNRNGDIGAVWEQSDPKQDELYFALLRDGKLMAPRKVATAPPSIFSPDLAFDAQNIPWIAWVQSVGQQYFVFVKNLHSEKVWLVNRDFPVSASTPKLIATADQKIWIFWVGQDRGRDEIFISVFEGFVWSKPYKLNSDSRCPHLSPSVELDGNGFPWVVWSAYDGHDYEIYSSHWNGRIWSKEEKITENDATDSSPAVSFIYGAIPIVVWSQSLGQASSLAGKYKSGLNWSPEIQIASSEGHFYKSPKIAVREGCLGITWQSGDDIEFLSMSFQELGQLPSFSRKRSDYPPIFNPALDDNQYTGFGDSITYAEEHGYLPKLEVMLNQKYGTSKVINEGIGGEGTTDGLARMDSVLAAHPARYLMLMEGTNDIIFLEVSMDTVAFNLEAMARKCLNYGAFPLLATIIPRNDWRWSLQIYKNRIFDLNTKIRTLTEKIKIPLVDQFNAFYNYPADQGGWTSLLLPDGVHPNEKGFYFMAETWLGVILPLPFPPANLRIQRTYNEVLFYRQPGNMLFWQNSPKLTAPDDVEGYRLYRKEQTGGTKKFELLSFVPRYLSLLEYRYFDIRIVQSSKYTYVISAVRKDGIEGPCSEVVNDYF
jgi:lysophospholipase L1-like esterase